MTVTLRAADAADLAAINARYADIDFLPSHAGELMVVAEWDGDICGQGRVVPVGDDSGELGGIFVLPAFEGRGIARSLVDWLILQSRWRVLYCLPFAELADFYGEMGFVSVTNDAGVPGAVLEKHRWCQGAYDKPVLLMRRAGLI